MDFVCPFPLPEDLALLLGPYSNAYDWIAPSTLPRLTRSLKLGGMVGSIGSIMHRLLDLQDCLRFTKMALVWTDEKAFKLAMDLILRCSRTVESPDLAEDPRGVFPLSLYPIRTLPPRLDPATTMFGISAARKLKHLVFQCGLLPMRWVTTALQTVDSKVLQQITVRPNPYNFRYTSRPMEWGDLDRLLVQFWISHSIRPKVTYESGLRTKDMRDLVP